METKTITIDIAAYERLRCARLEPTESFSRVILRAQWPDRPKTAAALLEAMKAVPAVDLKTLDYLDEVQKQDEPPEFED